MTNRYKQRRERILSFLGDKCAKCGSIEKLEIDHIDNLSKNFDISKSFSYKWITVEAELKLCQLLCRPCHVEKTKLDLVYNNKIDGFIAIPQMPPKKLKIIPHGTVSGYNYYRCRCSDCKTWAQSKQKELRAKNKLQIISLTKGSFAF